MTPTPHDALFRATFCQPEHAAGALRAALPPEIAERVDFASLAHVPGSFIDEELSGSHTDLLYSVRLSGRRALFYLLYEHQSTPRRLMPLDVLTYEVRIWNDHVAKHPKEKLLPAILTVVLYHGESGWSAATSFEALLDLDDATRAALAEHVPRFRLLIDDVGRQEDGALRSRAMTALGRLVLLCFKYARDPDELVRRLIRWADVMREVWRAPNGAAALGLVVRYIYEVGGERPVRTLSKLAAGKVGEDVEKAFVSYAEQLRREGRREGRSKGLREGRGKMLLRLMNVRFGELPEAVVAQIKAAKSAQLDLWAERILDAATLDDVFRDD
jgi:hypothetical protein